MVRVPLLAFDSLRSNPVERFLSLLLRKQYFSRLRLRHAVTVSFLLGLRTHFLEFLAVVLNRAVYNL
jgi:hypothetical protein